MIYRQINIVILATQIQMMKTNLLPLFNSAIQSLTKNSLVEKLQKSLVVIVLLFNSIAVSGQETLSCSAGTIVGTTMTFNTTNFTFVHAKGTDINFASYSPWRIYTDNTVTFTGSANVKRIISIVITAANDQYATAAANGTLTIISGTGTATGSTSASVATITVTGSNVKAITLKPSAQSRWVSITINYEPVSICTSPSTQASSFTSSSITTTSATAGWTRGNGTNVLVVARAGTAVNEDPTSGTSYTANAAFGFGTQIGTGNYVVYNGTGNSINLTGLTAGSTYHFAVYEYNSADNCYNLVELTGNFNTLAGAAPCLSENFNSFTSGAPSGWSGTGCTNYTTAGSSGVSPNSVKFDDTNDFLTTPILTGVAKSLSFWILGNSTNASSAFLIEGFNGTSWVTVENITSSIPTTGTTYTYNASSSPALPLNISQFRFTYTKSAGNVAFDDVIVTCGTPSPTITASATDLTLNSYTENSGPVSPSTKSFTVAASALTANLVLTAPANFEISENATSGYSATLSFSPVSGTVTSKTIYTRLKGGLSGTTTPYTGILTIASTDATTKNINLTGIVDDSVDYSKLDYPQTGSITEGGIYNVYIKAYEPGITDSPGNQSQITAWVGYSSVNNNPNSTGWIWVAAPFESRTDGDTNYQYSTNLNSVNLPAGNYFYAARFQIGTGPYTYGGIQSNNNGGNWDGSTYKSGTLTVNANVINGGELVPDTASISEGQNTNVEVEFYEAGLTDSPGIGLPSPTVEIAVSTTNTDPSTWPVGDWKTSTYNRDNGNNDVYRLSTGSTLTPAAYYYAGRVKKSGALSYKYIGKNFTEWSPANGNGILTVNSLIGFGNYQSPGSGSFTVGTIYDVFGQVYVAGVTPGPGQGSNIVAQVGYSLTDTDPSGAGWTWVNAQYNTLGPAGNNDEYMHNIGADISTAGTYYLAFRYQKDLKSWYYGGYNSRGGGQWNGTTNKNAVVNVIAVSASSDIVVASTFTHPVNIPYVNYQAADIIADTNSIEVAKFTIRDGGNALNDTDNLDTKLTSLKINILNFANIRRVALYDGSTEIGSEQISAGTVTFTGLNLVAPDNGTKDFSIRVSFKTVVTDNQQIQFTITEASGGSTGFSKFAATNAGGAASSIAGDDNRIEVIADRLLYTTQPVNGVINVNLSTIVLKAQDINANLDLDATNSITLTTSGTGMTSGTPYDLTAGVLNISDVQFGTEQVQINLTATTAGFAFSNEITSTLFNVTAYAFVNGDVKPAYDGSNFSYNNGWEQYDGTTWTLRTASLQTTRPAGRILIDKKNIGGGGTTSYTYLNDIFVLKGGELLIDDRQPNNSYDSWYQFLSTKKNIVVKEGGKLTIEGDIKLISTNNFIVESGGHLILNSPFIGNDHPMWAGKENFEEGSFVTVKDWNRIGVESYTSLLNTDGLGITKNSGGFLFGNLIIEGDIQDDWVIVGGKSFNNLKLCENNLEISNTSPDKFISGTSNDISEFIVNGDFIIYDGAFNFSTTFNGNIDFTNNFVITGNFIDISNDALKLHSIVGGTSNPSGNVTIKGDIVISPTVIISNDGQKNIVLEGGDELSPKIIDIGANVLRTNIDINKGYRRLKQDLILGTNTKVTVKANAALDFGFNNDNTGNTALVIRRFNNDASQTNQGFSLVNNGILKITSPQGITNSGDYTGNVQVGSSAANRTFGGNATYYFIGRENQFSGNGLPDAASSKKVIVDLSDDSFTFQPNGLKKINSGGYLEIKKGIVLDNATGSFEDASTSNLGELRMSGGRYRLFKTGTNPGLSGLYNLTGGVVEFANANLTSQTIRSKSYLNIEVTGKPVGNSTGNITLLDNGTFTIKPGGEFTINARSIIGPDGVQTVTVENDGVFRTGDEDGFSGSNQTSINSDIENINLADNSTVEYSRAGAQKITVFRPLAEDESNVNTGGYYNLKLTGDNGVLALATAKSIESTTPVYVRNNLEIAPLARLIVDVDKTMIVKSNIINNGGEARNLIVKSDGNLRQIDDSVINTTPIAVRRIHTLTGVRKQYNYISSPVIDQNMKLIFGDVLTNVPFVTVLNEVTNKFVNAVTADYGIPARGFSVREPKDSYTGVDLGGGILTIAGDEAEYKGSPNNGIISLPLPRTHTDGGYNVVGNPYPSNLDIVDLYNNSVNNLDIDTDFKFWDNSINDIYTQMGTAYQGYSYAVFNVANANGLGTAAPGRASDPGDPKGTKVPTRVVKVSQAFMVRALKAGASFKFNNKMRKTTATPFFGKEVAENYFRLEYTTPDQLVIQNAVSYFVGGNIGFGIEDSVIPNSTASDALFSLVDSEKVIINGRPLFTNEDIVPLGIRSYMPGTYSIKAIDQVGIFASGQSIYLKDKNLGILTDISQEAYSFVSTSGEFTNRFEIVYTPEAVLATGGSGAKANIQVYRDAQDFVVQSSVKKITSYELYDMSGRIIMSQKTNAKEVRFNAERLIDGAYVLKAELEDGKYFMKKVRK